MAVIAEPIQPFEFSGALWEQIEPAGVMER
jgi:hypothetical protein